MLKILAPMVLLLFSFEVLATEFPIVIREYIDDIKIDAYINKTDLDSLEPWTPFESPPRLSVGGALMAVKNYIDADTRYADFSLVGIELKLLPQHERYWHYIVKINTLLEDRREPGFFIVLMDGKVIPAIMQPDSIK